MKIFLLRLMLVLLPCTPVLAEPYFVQCFDFGCKTTHEIHFSASQWNEIRALFAEDVGDSAEKQAIRRAVALMERFSGEVSGTSLDKGGNYPGSDLPRQMDCIDESTNTLQYLWALQELDLLRWHQVDQKHRRIIWFLTHWTASVREVDSGRVIVVDSWYRDNGELPYLQPLQDWSRKRDFGDTLNPDLAAN
jgi:hypothetical protein